MLLAPESTDDEDSINLAESEDGDLARPEGKGADDTGFRDTGAAVAGSEGSGAGAACPDAAPSFLAGRPGIGAFAVCCSPGIGGGSSLAGLRMGGGSSMAGLGT